MSNKTVVIHDLNTSTASEILNTSKAEVFEAEPMVQNCVGCFGCWLKTPGKCVIKDRANITPSLFANASEVIIISRLLYGGFSPSIKAVFDRSIAYVMPFFRIIEGEMHHTMRYSNSFKMTIHFYEDDISDAEKMFAEDIVKANALNFGSENYEVTFHSNIQELRGVAK